jgi:hypothetical protein
MVVYIPLINCQPGGFRISIQAEQTHIGSTPVSNSTFGAIDPLGFRSNGALIFHGQVDHDS